MTLVEVLRALADGKTLRYELTGLGRLSPGIQALFRVRAGELQHKAASDSVWTVRSSSFEMPTTCGTWSLEPVSDEELAERWERQADKLDGLSTGDAVVRADAVHRASAASLRSCARELRERGK